MNPTFPVERGRFQGVGQIIAFNWHWYAIGVATGLSLVIALIATDWFASLQTAAAASLILASSWSVASLVVSHWVYDRSGLCDWRWLSASLSRTPQRWCNFHCGLDESSNQLRDLFPCVDSTVLDIFDPNEMTEASILRAREHNGCAALGNANFRELPVATGTMDAAFLLFAAHELRRPEARDELFAEVRRILRAGGEAVVAEHLRDAPNFAAFGPGAFHFFSAREWRRVFQQADLPVFCEFKITPFVRVFILRKAL